MKLNFVDSSLYFYSHSKKSILKIDKKNEVSKIVDIQCIGKYGKLLAFDQSTGNIYANCGPCREGGCEVIVVQQEGEKTETLKIDWENQGIAQILPLNNGKFAVVGNSGKFSIFSKSSLPLDLYKEGQQTAS